MATYSLGSFTFINLEGVNPPGAAPQTIRQTAFVVQRPGTAGTGFITTGVKGQDFQMRSIVDVLTGADAQALCFEYEAAINSGLLVLVHASADYSATPVFSQYWVLHVQARWYRTSAAVGGLAGGLFVVEAIWTLIPVFVPEEEE